MTTLSIIIPAYNEELRIGETIEQIETYLSDRSMDAEIIVVDDGSIDATSEVVATCAYSNLRVIRVDRNRGKGHAVRIGMLAASGDLRLFMDADGSTPIGELDRLQDELEKIGGSGVALASIAMPGARIVRPQSGFRSAVGRLGNRLIRLIALRGVADSQRGFKLFSADATAAVFSKCQVNGWGFDVEVLVLAKRFGFEIIEVPVTWTHMDDSRVTPMSYVATLIEVLGVRWRMVRGLYDQTESASEPLR